MALQKGIVSSLVGPSRLASTSQVVVCSRCFSSSALRAAGQEEGRNRFGDEGRGRRSRDGDGPRTFRRRTMLPPFEEWVRSRDAETYKYPKPQAGPNWIGDTPFPLNPSFNPPPPVNARFRDELWKLHSENPQANNVRALSSRFSIGPDRVLAILRLKALEKEMTADAKPLQTEFQRNMDRLLGATSRNFVESEPAAEVSTASPRGPVMEDFSENEPDGMSTLKPALEAAGKESARQRKGLPTGGPDPRHESTSKTLQGAQSRPRLTIVEVGGKSYQGAGRVERNERRAAKRQALKRKQKEAKKSA